MLAVWYVSALLYTVYPPTRPISAIALILALPDDRPARCRRTLPPCILVIDPSLTCPRRPTTYSPSTPHHSPTDDARCIHRFPSPHLLPVALAAPCCALFAPSNHRARRRLYTLKASPMALDVDVNGRRHYRRSRVHTGYRSSPGPCLPRSTLLSSASLAPSSRRDNVPSRRAGAPTDRDAGTHR